MRQFLCFTIALAFIAGCDPPPQPTPEGEPQVEGEGPVEGAQEGEGEVDGEPQPLPSNVGLLGECTFSIIKAYPHDTGAFTQGLVYHGGYFYEGTGQACCSQLRKVEPATGRRVEAVDVAEDFCTGPLLTCGGRTMNCTQASGVFGEGITVLGGKIYQLTWQHCIGFVYDAETMSYLSSFNYGHEGWGITHDGSRLIVSDGTSNLRFWDPYTMVELGSVQVRKNGQAVDDLNELEFIGGYVFANVWRSDVIVKIDPASGEVVATIDLTGLLSPAERTRTTDVLNGIAYDSERDRLFVTGKYWPKVFQIALLPK
jgi:glutaminyl-peptide cyclotransferase